MTYINSRALEFFKLYYDYFIDKKFIDICENAISPQLKEVKALVYRALEKKDKVSKSIKINKN